MEPVYFETAVEMGMFSAVQAVDAGEIEFPRYKVEIMRILQANVTARFQSLDLPPGPQRRLAIVALISSDPMLRTRINIGMRMLLEFMETPQGVTTILAHMGKGFRLNFLENSNYEIVVTTQTLGGFILNSMTDPVQVKKCREVQRCSTSLSSNHPLNPPVFPVIVQKKEIDRGAVQREYIAGLTALLPLVLDTKLSDEHYFIIADRLGAYSVLRLLSPDCPVLGIDEDRPQRMKEALAYPEDNLTPIDSDRRMKVGQLLRRCIHNLEKDLVRRDWFAENAETLE